MNKFRNELITYCMTVLVAFTFLFSPMLVNAEGNTKSVELTLSKDYKNCRELHIEPDWLLIYKYEENDLILYLVRTGSHSDLF